MELGGGEKKGEKKGTTVVSGACRGLAVNECANAAFRIFPTLKLFVPKTGEEEIFPVGALSRRVSTSPLKPEERSAYRGLIFPKGCKAISSFDSGSLRWLSLFLFNLLQ